MRSASPLPFVRPGRALVAVALLLLGLASALAAAPAGAADGTPFSVTVAYVSDEPGGVDPGASAQRLDQLLRARVRYSRLQVLEQKRLSVPPDGIGTVHLPNGRDFRFRLIDVGEGGALVAVDFEKTAQGDFRIPKGKPLILGGTEYQKGQLVVVLEALP